MRTETPPEVVLRLEDVSVVYKVNKLKIRDFREYAIRRMKREVLEEDFWALRDVNLDLYRGEVFGIIGRNGAGKSTLLKTIAKVIRPTSGRVWVKGYVAPLLEMGAGFHLELTGRENIYQYGSLLGFAKKEMEQKLERIVEFAELWDFIDSPLRTYSTGMISRLAFSIATDVKPDILIVDEILGVGDEAFQRKSRERMFGFAAQGSTILLVTHSSQLMMDLCERALWLDRGRTTMIGPAREVVTAYHNSTL